MPTFALITEGHTDQVILQRIIELICKGGFEEEVEVNPLQPLRDETDANTKSFGGWELVFEYCRVAFNDALGANDFVVVHVDTDMGEHKNFGLPLTHEGQDRGYADLMEGARQIIIRHIGAEIFEEATSRVIFAISIHSIESWLLLYLFDQDEPKNSFYKLDRLLKRGDQDPLVKEIPRYRELASKIRLKKLSKMIADHNSFSSFLSVLANLGAEKITD